MPAFVPVCLIAASLLLLFSLPALVQRKLHLGVVFPTAVSLTLFLYAGLACAFPGIPALYVCGAVLTAFIAVGAVFVLVCSLLMCIGWRRAAAQAVRGDETVLVLGLPRLLRPSEQHAHRTAYHRICFALQIPKDAMRCLRWPGRRRAVYGGRRNETVACGEGHPA